MARIRTIKPEFWTNEKLASLSELANLLALALLNYADDEGYFNANPKLVQAGCFPLREPSRDLREVLGELESIDYLRRATDDEGRTWGWVVGFSKHQKVDHPGKSRIKGLADFREGVARLSRDVREGLAPDLVSRIVGSRSGEPEGSSAQAPEPPGSAPTVAGPRPCRSKKTPKAQREASEVGSRVLARMAALSGCKYRYSEQLEARIAEGVPEADLLAVVEHLGRDSWWVSKRFGNSNAPFWQGPFADFLAQARAGPPSRAPAPSGPTYRDLSKLED